MDQNKIKNLLLISLVFLSIFPLSSCLGLKSASDEIKSIPIQHNGRIKSFHAFSSQTVRLVTGKNKWNNSKSHLLIFETLKNPKDFSEILWIKNDYSKLTSELGFEKTKRYFSYNEITPHIETIKDLVRSSQNKRDQDIRPLKIEQKAETLLSRYFAVDGLIHETSIKVIPPPKNAGNTWLPSKGHHLKSGIEFKDLINAYTEGSQGKTHKAVKEWILEVGKIAENLDQNKIKLEVIYYDLKPFKKSWILYLIAFLTLTFSTFRQKMVKIGIIAFCLGFLFHTIGLILRVLILSRPPVSNMYESMVFMNWAIILFAILFLIFQKRIFLLSTASIVSALVMIYADLLPIDPSLDVLVPVLRSNYWLSVHVLTVVSSYGAFALAMALGHRHLILHIFNKFNEEDQKKSTSLMLRVIEFGVILIGTGTVLGGIWANESWGRFWGWDPKETWALITLLGYLVIIHLRYFKKITHFGLAIGSILGFLLVLMTWYGVNFVLGRGLHSYGSGTGGLNWIIYYLIFEAIFIGFILLKKPRS